MTAVAAHNPAAESPFVIEGVVPRPATCALCQMGEKHPVLARLWEMRGAGSDRDGRTDRELRSAVVIKARRQALAEFAEKWAAHIEAYIAQHEDEADRYAELLRALADGSWRLTAEAVERHFHHHRAEAVQPVLSRGKRAEALVGHLRDRLAPRHWAVLDCLSHLGRMTTEQLARIFYPSAGSRLSALSAMERDLSWLSYNHAVYRGYQRRPRGRTHLVVWSLGVVGAELLVRDGITSELPPHVRSREQFHDGDLNHDLGLVEALLALWQRQRDADPMPLGPGVAARVTLPPSYVETDRTVTELRAVVPLHAFRGHPQPGMEGWVRPDALVSLVAELPEGATATMGGREVALHSTLLPLLLEWDTSKVDLADVAKQLTDYLWLHATGSIEQRFPQLASVPALARGTSTMPYRIPLVMVTHSRSLAEHNHRHRALAIWRTTRERYANMTLPEPHARLHPPIIITTATDLAEHGLAAPSLSLWQADEHARTPLLTALVNSSAPLLASGALDPRLPLHTRPAEGRHKLTRLYHAARVGAWREDTEDGDEF